MSATRPHRKLVKHYHEPGDLHELTFSCFECQPLLTNDAWRLQLARCIDAAAAEFEIQLGAFVFMPEYVHLLVVPTGNEPAIDRYLARIKKPFSKWVKQQLLARKSPLVERLTLQERPGKTCFQTVRKNPSQRSYNESQSKNDHLKEQFKNALTLVDNRAQRNKLRADLKQWFGRMEDFRKSLSIDNPPPAEEFTALCKEFGEFARSQLDSGQRAMLISTAGLTKIFPSRLEGERKKMDATLYVWQSRIIEFMRSVE